MKAILGIFIILFLLPAAAQEKKPEDFGFRHLTINFKNEVVHILLQSKKGEEHKKKPLFLFCQGSLPQPLLKIDAKGMYPVFPFITDDFLEHYHIAIVNKPGIPVLSQIKSLNDKFLYLDADGTIPKAYTERNYLTYYVDRNLKVIKYLHKLPYIDDNKLIVAGHSEGSTIAAKLAAKTKKITHLIYASGCPLGRIMAMIAQGRFKETDTDSTRFAEDTIKYWEDVVNDNQNLDGSHGDSNKTTYDFSEPSIIYLEKLTIPVLVCYGTKDWSTPYNDYLRVEITRQHKKNFTFNSYIGLEHNFFPIKPDATPDYEHYNWDKVANDWLVWIKNN